MSERRGPRVTYPLSNHDLERRIGTWLVATDLEPGEAEPGLQRLLSVFPTIPQARRRSMGRWFDRGGRARRRAPEHERRHTYPDRRDRLVSIGTILVAGLALVGITFSALPRDQNALPAAAGQTLTVASDGSGAYPTIRDAIAAASPGDTVLIEPGTYTGPIVVDKDITLTGDGSRDEVVVTWGSDGPTHRLDAEDWEGPFGVLLDGSDATVASLTLSGPHAGVAVIISGGHPVVRDVAVEMEQDTTSMDLRVSFYIGAAGCDSSADCQVQLADVTVLDSSWDAYFALRGGGSAVLEGNTITADTVSLDGPGTVALRDNTFLAGASTSLSAGATGVVEGNDMTGGGIGVDTGSDVSVRDNVIRDVSSVGQAAISLTNDGTHADVSNNRISGSAGGVVVTSGAMATISANHIETSDMGISSMTGEVVSVEGNQLSDNAVAIYISSPGSLVADNVIAGGRSGIVLAGGVALTGNSVEGVSGRGISISGGATHAVLSGNHSCDNGENLWVAESAAPAIDDSNDICEAIASE
jgi:nitrous oxidase accessory protein NosD